MCEESIKEVTKKKKKKKKIRQALLWLSYDLLAKIIIDHFSFPIGSHQEF